MFTIPRNLGGKNISIVLTTGENQPWICSPWILQSSHSADPEKSHGVRQWGSSSRTSRIWLVVSTNPSEKYDFVSWDYYSQYMGKIFFVPNHQPEDVLKPPTSNVTKQNRNRNEFAPWEPQAKPGFQTLVHTFQIFLATCSVHLHTSCTATE